MSNGNTGFHIQIYFSESVFLFGSYRVSVNLILKQQK